MTDAKRVALSLLESWKGSDYDRKVPWPVVDREKRAEVAASMKRNMRDPSARDPVAKDYPIERVPHHKLVATQSGVFTKYLKARKSKDRPLAVKHGGKYYVKDGHHRLVSDHDRGETHSEMHVIPDDK